MYWFALRFPYLSLDALGVDLEKQSAMVVSSRQKVLAATPKCREQGVELGMPASTASLLVNCEVLERNKDKEAALLTQICDVLYAFTPYIQVYCPNSRNDLAEQGVLLELTRCIRLFKGLEPLLMKIVAAINRLQLFFFSAVAQSGKAAWLLSYQDSGMQGIDIQSTDLQAYVKELKPMDFERISMSKIDLVKVEQLEEFPEEAEALMLAGFKTLADLRSQIENEGLFSLQKRFQPQFISYLKDIFGHSFFQSPSTGPQIEDQTQQQVLFTEPATKRPSVVYEPERLFVEAIDFDFPLTALELLQEPMKQLLQKLSDYLVYSQQQCSGITWRFIDIYQNDDYLQVRSERIYRDWQLLFELSLIQLERSGLPFEIDRLELIRPLLAPVHFEELSLETDIRQSFATDKHIQRITAKMQARVGESKVFKVSVKEEHIPELSQSQVDGYQEVNDVLTHDNRYTERPSWLLNKPVSIGKHQNDLYWYGRVQIIRGPEKITGHWWDKAVERDYFTAVRDDHVRLWVFHDALTNEWCVQGVF